MDAGKLALVNAIQRCRTKNGRNRQPVKLFDAVDIVAAADNQPLQALFHHKLNCGIHPADTIRYTVWNQGIPVLVDFRFNNIRKVRNKRRC